MEKGVDRQGMPEAWAVRFLHAPSRQSMERKRMKKSRLRMRKARETSKSTKIGDGGIEP